MRNPMWKASKFTLMAAVASVVLVLALALGIAFGPSARAQTPPAPARPMITQSIVEANLVRLFGNVRPEATAANDRGRVPDSFSMEHMLLQLKRPPAQEQALNQLIDQLHDPASPNFHRWLSPNQFGAQFGPAASDIQQVTGWLQRHGLSVNVVYPSGMTIDFSGTAGQVLAAFHTEIHYLQAKGATHFANMSDPQIPAALASATPSGTHSFVQWTQSGRVVSTSQSYTFTLSANTTLVADFK
jgi:subtilase family serine protease